MVVSNIFYFHPYLGKISNLTNIFQMGWKHPPAFVRSFSPKEMWRRRTSSPSSRTIFYAEVTQLGFPENQQLLDIFPQYQGLEGGHLHFMGLFQFSGGANY